MDLAALAGAALKGLAKAIDEPKAKKARLGDVLSAVNDMVTAASTAAASSRDPADAISKATKAALAVGLENAEKIDPLQLRNPAGCDYTRDLPSKEIRVWLAKCARDCNGDRPAYTIEDKILQVPDGVCVCKYEKNGMTCAAIRGTDASNPSQIAQDIAIFVNPDWLQAPVDLLSKWMKDNSIDYITGHSLGGFLAEAVASKSNLDGASFNSPGGRGAPGAFGKNWSTGTRFEVHLNKGDPVSAFRAGAHIAEPKWHSYGGVVHGIGGMIEDLQNE